MGNKAQRMVADAQAAERRAQESRAKKLRKAKHVIEPVVESKVGILRFTHRQDTLQGKCVAWDVLKHSPTLQIVAPRFRYADAKQFATGAGSFELLDVPFSLARKIESELAPIWMKAAMPQLKRTEEAAVEPSPHDA